jgi:cytochrome c
MRAASVLLAGALLLAGCGKNDTPTGQSSGAAAGPEVTLEPTLTMGEQVFKRCVACHTIDKGGANGIGPNLHGVVGRPVASHAGFSYSSAMKAKGGVWDAATLDTYLEAPMKALPGTRMAFAGVYDPLDRKALLLYLEAQK